MTLAGDDGGGDHLKGEKESVKLWDNDVVGGNVGVNNC